MNAQLLKSQETQQYWRIQSAGRCMDYKFNVHTKVIRLMNERHRMFLLEETGILRTRIQIRNEYSIEVGSVFFSANRTQTGTLLLDDTKYIIEKKPDSLQFTDASKNLLFTLTLPAQRALSSHEMTALIIAASQFRSDIAYHMLATG